ncbi:hypothetical protein AB0M20_12945 [Actinoplanes sp. NPDC051633]|uniref:hypothetical protein n=1 Tax=Actinoplanes sp. NPDC051633 TaxID=3155670 RepID=UPI00341485B1
MAVFLYVVSTVLVLSVLFVIIRAGVSAGVQRGLESFLQEASREEPARSDHPVPRRIDMLAVHLATITRRPPEE